jgi:subtilisin family serine protease
MALRFPIQAFMAIPILLYCLFLTQTSGLAQTLPGAAPAYRADRILIKPKPGMSRAALAGFHAAHKGKVLRTFDGIGGLQILQVPEGETVPGLVAKYRGSGLVDFAEPDYSAYTMATTPNDPKYLDHTLWGLDKISAPAGWDVLTSASNILVAVLDTGVRYTHEDLAANMWLNPNDGGHGLNALAETNDPWDDNGHGTLVAGVLGAVGNNATGVVGVAWRVQIMACKCFNSFGQGNDSDIITCIDYALTNGAQLINASWGVTNSLAVSNALAAARDAGIIVIAAAGNNATNIDLNPSYPSGFHLDNVVSVAYTTKTDTLAAASNYGATNVHLAAPGEQIYSTFAASDNFYLANNTGSSFAAPYVTGTLALMLAKYPAETYQQIIARVLAATDPLPSLTGKCVTGGRLNLRNALSPPIRLTAISGAANGPFTLRLSGGPNRTCVIQRSSTLTTNWFPVFTNTTSAGGTFDYTDTHTTNVTRRFYRGVSTL